MSIEMGMRDLVTYPAECYPDLGKVLQMMASYPSDIQIRMTGYRPLVEKGTIGGGTMILSILETSLQETWTTEGMGEDRQIVTLIEGLPIQTIGGATRERVIIEQEIVIMD